MGNFKRNNRPGRDFGRRFDARDSDRDSNRPGRREFGRSSRSFEMHKSVCAECGSECEVPFKPTSNKPVYCSDCFKKKDSGSRNRNNQSSDRLDQINANLIRF